MISTRTYLTVMHYKRANDPHRTDLISRACGDAYKVSYIAPEALDTNTNVHTNSELLDGTES